MSLHIYFLRHGQTECSRNNAFCGSIDSELTPEGFDMAEALADRTHFDERLRSLPGT